MGRAGANALNQRRIILATEDPEHGEERVRTRSKKLSPYVTNKVPGKLSVLRIKCRKCNWEKDDVSPS